MNWSGEAQRRLAREVTKLVHGDAELAKAERASTILFGGAIGDITAKELEDVFVDVPSSAIAHHMVDVGIRIPDLVVQTGLASSKGEARRLIQGGGLYLNNQRVSEPDRKVGKFDVVAERFGVIPAKNRCFSRKNATFSVLEAGGIENLQRLSRESLNDNSLTLNLRWMQRLHAALDRGDTVAAQNRPAILDRTSL